MKLSMFMPQVCIIFGLLQALAALTADEQEFFKFAKSGDVSSFHAFFMQKKIAAGAALSGLFGGKKESPVSISTLCNVRDDKEKTLLHYAAEGGHFTMVDFLKQQGASIEAEDNQACTPIDLAANSLTRVDTAQKALDFLEIIRLLNGNLKDYQDDFEQGILALVTSNTKMSQGDKVELVKYLFENYKSEMDANSKVFPGGTLFSLAIKEGNTDLALLLLHNGADANLVAMGNNMEQKAPLVLVAKSEMQEKEKIEIMGRLISKGADVECLIKEFGFYLKYLEPQYAELLDRFIDYEKFNKKYLDAINNTAYKDDDEKKELEQTQKAISSYIASQPLKLKLSRLGGQLTLLKEKLKNLSEKLTQLKKALVS